LGPQVQRVLDRLNLDEALTGPNPNTIGEVRVEGEAVDIPYRLWLPQPESDRGQGVESVISSCLFTRNHDGFVRQNHLSGIIDSAQSFVVPFVLQLLGEYVVEIGEEIVGHLDRLPIKQYQSFAEENDEYLGRLQAKLVSYYVCYYRRRYPLTQYPPFIALQEMGVWHRRIPQRLAKPARPGWSAT
jgi:hypothetical protein